MEDSCPTDRRPKTRHWTLAPRRTASPSCTLLHPTITLGGTIELTEFDPTAAYLVPDGLLLREEVVKDFLVQLRRRRRNYVIIHLITYVIKTTLCLLHQDPSRAPGVKRFQAAKHSDQGNHRMSNFGPRRNALYSEYDCRGCRQEQCYEPYIRSAFSEAGFPRISPRHVRR